MLCLKTNQGKSDDDDLVYRHDIHAMSRKKGVSLESDRAKRFQRKDSIHIYLSIRIYRRSGSCLGKVCVYPANVHDIHQRRS